MKSVFFTLVMLLDMFTMVADQIKCWIAGVAKVQHMVYNVLCGEPHFQYRGIAHGDSRYQHAKCHLDLSSFQMLACAGRTSILVKKESSCILFYFMQIMHYLWASDMFPMHPMHIS